MKWITRERPKIDRIACPWLIRRFIDPNAEFIFVPFNEVLSKSQELDAIPFDIPEVEYTHYEEKTTFDYFITKHKLDDPALLKLAPIVRGADTDRHELAPEVAGLWAISAGMSFNITDDHELLKAGFVIYDALYSWAKHLSSAKHLENSPFEKLLHDVYQKLLNDREKKQPPKWVKELREVIQDHLDAQYYDLDLKRVSDEVDLNASYLSREFSKYFDDKNFAEYIRSARIEKAIRLLENQEYTLTEIAYLTGFSDQSHFTRIFKKITGHNPSYYRKHLLKK
jgi:AraC-like DNA-binding protein